jgi:hypothetical protein
MSNVYSYRGPHSTTLVILVAAIVIGMALVPARVSADTASGWHGGTYSHSTPSSVFRLVQDSDDDTDSEVPPDQVEKYVSVYKDMQRDRSLTVDAAAAKEGLTVNEFRELEQKVERDDSAREHARTELEAAVSGKP